MGTIGLVTRSRTTGYKAFPSTGTSWWESREYRRLTRVEAPTIVLEASDRGSIGFFLAGIRSQQRTDHVGTPIRYSLFGVADTNEEVRRLASAAESFCDDSSLRELALWLDETIGGDVEDWMESNLDSTTEAPFLASLQSQWTGRFSDASSAAGSIPFPRMTVGLGDSSTRELIRAFVGEISREGCGAIMFLNLVNRDEYEGLGVVPFLGLLHGSEPPTEIKKKVPHFNSPPLGFPREGLGWVLAAGCLLLLVILLIIFRTACGRELQT